MRVRPFYMLVTNPTGRHANWFRDLYLEAKPMQEDKREKVRLASDVMLSGTWHNLARSPLFPFTANEAVMREAELEAARQRARLSVLDLTERDKRFLRDMKIAV